ncbi:cupin domain-containing protein [Rhizorhabdus histidinilytica]|uniref:Cupin domain-containing protein n=1 Tax=Rhizorhabdus histidinilytica TaxID=439228 RepID=A0A1T5EJQ3_9SPHN|nr:cupin domain-containing protein [Rhizorhabdus histidinilytica]SKB84253.1 Cupin domain-containing protein [Rhizorhabdus histidinilytica]
MRRVITGVVDGKSVFLADGEPANAHEYTGWPGHLTSVVWATAAPVALPVTRDAEPQPGIRVSPEAGETRLMVVRFPPDTIFADPRFDGPGYGAEAATHLPGLIDAFEPDGSGFHTTRSIDYDVVLDGEIWLELDDGAETRLGQGDIVVQGGTRHAWRNRSDRDAVMLFVLVGAGGA